jgi:hypothetical protein
MTVSTSLFLFSVFIFIYFIAVILFLVEKSLAKINCLPACLLMYFVQFETAKQSKLER